MSNTDSLVTSGAGTSAPEAATGAEQHDADNRNGTAVAGGAVSNGAASGAGSNGAESNGAPGVARRRGGLSGMVLADLRSLAGELGITDTTGMRKSDLVAAIKERRSNGSDASPGPTAAPAEAAEAPAAQGTAPENTEGPEQPRNPRRRRSNRPAGAGNTAETAQDQQSAAPDGGGDAKSGAGSEAPPKPETDGREQQAGGDQGRVGGGDRPARGGRQQSQQNGERPAGRNDGETGGGRDSGADGDGRGGRRGRRYRDRRRGRGSGGRGEADTEVREDDVLLPVAGIVDVLDNYAFVRTSGYLAGQNDVYVSLSMVRKYALRRGDAVTGVVRQPREGESQRQKFNPLVRVETVNGLDPEEAKKRPEFTKLTPLYPNDRLRLETEPAKLTTRAIDLIMPVGKGQRALITSPPKAGKTTILQDVANAITRNNPECYLMVVLVDERPEEVTDMQRSVKGEVIASTFDRPPSDHTAVAELSIERAKRLVEAGQDVVVLLDSITRLGRAYNLAAPASGRILSGGVDSTALYPPKRFLGAARNIEEGGSLTIMATAMVETGSTMDTVIFEEFKGTGNAELKLDRKASERRVFPAIDVHPSGTRKEELLLAPDELGIVRKLYRVLHALDTQQAIDTLLGQLKKTRTNIEFLMQVAKSMPTPADEGDE